MQSQKPKISVIVVARNQKDVISACLESILRLDYDNYDVIAVDDCSEDGTAEIVEKFPVQLIRLNKQGGPALARNSGAERSCADILLFLDSDVIAAKNILSEILLSLENSPGAQAVQGVYSRESVPGNIVTRYRDYFDDYKNQGITSDFVKIISTCCFAIKRDVFFEVGGFDAQIKGATVEDNDLGYRLFASGNRVVLNRNLTVTHLKRYSLKSLLERDYIVSFNMVKFFLRVKLAARRGSNFGIPLSSGEKTNAFFAASIILSFITFILSVLWASSGFAMHYSVLFLALMLAFILINLKYLRLLSKVKGRRFCFVWIIIFYLDMLFASFGLLNGGMDFFIFKRKY